MDPSTTLLVDTHCHLDLYPDPPAVLQRIEMSGVHTIAVTNTPSVFAPLVRLVGQSNHANVALGLHPELAQERVGELSLFESLIAHTRFIGEVGLDYATPDSAVRALQRKILGSIIAWCQNSGDKVVSVHSRRAADDVVDAFGRFRGTFILHWYSGSVRTLSKALANGAYVSVNPAMIRSEHSMALLKHVAPERILTETDGPFVSASGAPAEPADVIGVIAGLSKLWQTDAAHARATVYSNFIRIMS